MQSECLTHHVAPRYLPVSSWARCIVQRLASQTCCIVWSLHQCPGLALWCPSWASVPAGCQNQCPQRSSCPAAEKQTDDAPDQLSEKLANIHIMKDRVVYLQQLFICKWHDALKYNHTGPIHRFLHTDKHSLKVKQKSSHFHILVLKDLKYCNQK